MITCAPARIDLAGGTIDIPPLCHLIDDSLTINLAIDLCVRLDLEPTTPDRAFIPDYPIYHKTFDYLGADRNLRIQLENSIPRASGLGGSSSLLVALVTALETAAGHDTDLRTLLDKVTVLEHKLLGKPAGTQDAIAALYGGLNAITYDGSGPTVQQMAVPDFLKEPLLLLYSGVPHHSGLNNWEIIKAACEGERRTLDLLTQLNRNTHRMWRALKAGDREGFIATLSEEGQIRARLADGLMSPGMKAFAKAFRGRLACKVCGAGGGGCMFVYGEHMDWDEVAAVAATHELEVLKVSACYQGVEEGVR